MLNETGLFLLQAVLHLTNTRSPDNQLVNVTLLEDPISDPFFSDDSMVCYGMYGCFSTISPWIDELRPISNFPEHPAKICPRFCLHTRYNANECQYLNHTNSSSIFRSFFIPFHKTYVITHGFIENGEKPWLKNMSAEILKREDGNVIIIDWGNGSAPPYAQAVANTRLVGRMTALLIYTLTVLTGTNTEQFHLIGHSLGSHVSGYVGYTLKHHFNFVLGRITGMDPAEPHFADTQPVVRLDITDALFVDIIHTNAKPFISGGLGINKPIGHLDFYPNGGDNQPGCNHGMMKFIKTENQSMIEGVRRFLSCDHVRSHEFMLESVSSLSCTFLSVECDTWQNFVTGKCFPCRSKEKPNGYFCASFGYPALTEWQNSEYIKRKTWHPVSLFTITNSEKPFCAILYRVTVTISNSVESMQHKGEIGVFSIAINGTIGKTQMTPILKEQYFAPGSSHVYVLGGKNAGNISNAELYWEHPTSLNILTWRIDPIIHIGSVTIEKFTGKEKITLCPQASEVLSSKGTMKVKPC